MTDERPIGVFDSGFGGLTVAQALFDLLPEEHVVYVGDSARYPYGARPLAEVRAFAQEIATWLVERAGVKLVVVACNTASAAALSTLEDSLPVPVVGVIEPGVRAAVAATARGRLGIIATSATVTSGAYQRAFGALETAGLVELTMAACPGFVEFVERGETDSDAVHILAERLLSPLRSAAVDTLLLGCTHYPFLARTLADVMGRDVVLVSSAEETAFEVVRMLDRHDLRRGGSGAALRRWCSSGDASRFAQLGRGLLGFDLGPVECLEWGGASSVRDSPVRDSPVRESSVREGDAPFPNRSAVLRVSARVQAR